MKKILNLLIITAVLAGCSKSASTDNTAAVTPAPAAPALSAKFSVTNTINNDGVKEGDDVKFDNQSQNAVSFAWEFKYYNGLTVTSAERNPVMNFGCGDWTVKLNVTDAKGNTATISAPLLVYCKGRNAGGKDGHIHTGITGG